MLKNPQMCVGAEVSYCATEIRDTPSIVQNKLSEARTSKGIVLWKHTRNSENFETPDIVVSRRLLRPYPFVVLPKKFLVGGIPIVTVKIIFEDASNQCTGFSEDSITAASADNSFEQPRFLFKDLQIVGSTFDRKLKIFKKSAYLMFYSNGELIARSENFAIGSQAPSVREKSIQQKRASRAISRAQFNNSAAQPDVINLTEIPSISDEQTFRLNPLPFCVLPPISQMLTHAELSMQPIPPVSFAGYSTTIVLLGSNFLSHIDPCFIYDSGDIIVKLKTCNVDFASDKMACCTIPPTLASGYGMIYACGCERCRRRSKGFPFAIIEQDNEDSQEPEQKKRKIH
jgi:hypothetical protein